MINKVVNFFKYPLFVKFLISSDWLKTSRGIKYFRLKMSDKRDEINFLEMKATLQSIISKNNRELLTQSIPCLSFQKW